MKINERSKFIIKALLQNESYITASEIADTLQVSMKTVMRQLGAVEDFLQQHDLKLERKTSKGMRLVGSKIAKEKLQEIVAEKEIHHEYSPAERCNIILSQLLKSQEPIKLLVLSRLLDVTDTTISNDLDKLEPWIEKMNMKLVRKPGVGIYLEGLEKDIRKAIINHIYEHIHEKNILDLLYSKNSKSEKLLSDADKFLLDLVDKNLIQKVETAIRIVTEREHYDLSMNAFSGLVVHLTLAVQRLLKGEAIIINAKFLDELQGKQDFKLAVKIGEEIEKIFQIKVPQEEAAYIAMHLLGARNNYQKMVNSQYDNFHLIKLAKQMISIAEQESGIQVAKKGKLLIGLVKHLGPVATRMRLKMEIRNPLLKEMKRQYPKWMDLAKKAAKPLEDSLAVALPEAEIAYLAMHLGSAMEEANTLRQQFNILVACPTGIGTSRLLATQLKKEFPNLNIVGIVSAINIDAKRCLKENVSFIVSTVPINLTQDLERINLAVVVVNFMLNDEDKFNIQEQINKTQLLNKAQKNKVNVNLSERLGILNSYGKYISELFTGFFCCTAYKNSVIADTAELCKIVSNEIFPQDKEKQNILCSDLQKRESKGSTIFSSIMILHSKTKSVDKLKIGVMQISNVESAKENIATVLVMLVPQNADDRMLETMGYISECLVENMELLDILHEGSSKEIYDELEKLYTGFFDNKYKSVFLNHNL